MKKINRVIAMLLAIVMSFLCLSETVFAAEDKTAANERTSAMFAYFRNDRTTLDTSAVSPDELHVFGVFLSNFMIPGRTKLTEFFDEQSEINTTVAQIFFGNTGANNNEKTIAKLTSLIGSAMTDEDGLQPVSIIDNDNVAKNLTMQDLVLRLASNETDEKKQCLYLGDEPIVNITYTNFKLALAEVLAVSMTAEGHKGETFTFNKPYNNTEKKGIYKWLCLADENHGNGNIMVDCIGNFWYEENGDYMLFIPACLQSFVFEKKLSEKIPLVNSFYMGCMLDLEEMEKINGFEPYSILMAKALNNKQKKNAISMCVLEALEFDADKIEATSKNQKIDVLSHSNLITATEAKEVNLEKAHLLINASWSNYSYNEKPSQDIYIYLFDSIVSNIATKTKKISYNTDTVKHFTLNFCFTQLIPLEKCITEIYYFNTDGMKNNYNILQQGEDNTEQWKTSDNITITDVMLKETLFSNSKKYNTVVNSKLLNYLIEVNNVLNNNKLNYLKKCDGVDWQCMATTDDYDDFVDNLVIPNCNLLYNDEEDDEYTSVIYGSDQNARVSFYDLCKENGIAYDDICFLLTDNNSKPIPNNLDKDYIWVCGTTKTQKKEIEIKGNKYKVGYWINKDKFEELIVNLNKTPETSDYRKFRDAEYNGFYTQFINNLNDIVNIDSSDGKNYKGEYVCVEKSFLKDSEGIARGGLSVPLKGNGTAIKNSTFLSKPFLDEKNVDSERECCAFHAILWKYYSFNKETLIEQNCFNEEGYDSFKKFMNTDGNELLAPTIILYSITGNARLLKEEDYKGKDIKEELAKKLIHLYTGMSSDDLNKLDVKLNLNFSLSDSNNGYLEDVLTSSCRLDVTSEGNKNNIVLDFLYGTEIAGKKVPCKAFGTFIASNLATSFIAMENKQNPKFITISPLNFTFIGLLMTENVFDAFFGTSKIFSLNKDNIGPWIIERTQGIWLFDADGSNGTFDASKGNGGVGYSDNASNNAAFIGGLSMMLQYMYNYRIISIRSNLSKALTSNSNYNHENGQFVANGCNVWPGIYWSYMVSMLNVRTDNGALKNDSYNNPCLPFMKVATTGGGLDLSAIVSGEMGSEPIEDMTMEQKQEDLINKALSILSTETSEYRDNWFKSMIDSWLISAHKSVIGTYMNSELSFNMGVETGSTTYASVTGYVSTPQLTDISITKTIIDNYGVLYIIMLVIVIIYTFALVIIGAKGVKEGILVAVVLAIVLVFPQVLLNNAIGIMNSVVDSMYSDRFNFWAIAKHQTSLNALAEAKNYDEYVIASNIEMAKQVYSTDQGVRIKWPSPKKIDNFKAIFSDAIENPNSSVNLTIFKTLFNSFFNQEQYTYDALETYSYRPYNAIANEAKGYYNNYSAIIGQSNFESQLGNRLLDPFKIISKTLYTNSDTKSSSLYDPLQYDNTTYSDNTANKGNYAKVDVSVALACMLNNGLNERLGHNHEWDVTKDELEIEKGIDPEKITEDESLKLYYAYSESVFYYFYNVLKSEWNPISTDSQSSNKRLKDAMLETDTFEKIVDNGSRAYIRDFLGLEYLFEYVIPYLNEGNIYVQSYIDKYGMDISRYDFTAGDKITVGTGDDAKKQEELEAYNKAKAKKEEYGQVWLMYSSWVDQLYTACGVEKVGKERFCAINAADYQTYLNRDMVFSELDMQGKYDAELKGYVNKIDYTALSSVEQKIIKVLKNSYEDIMYLNNYWNYDEEVILTAAAMMATFNFNKEFSNYKILGDSNVLYPQNYELQNFNYDAFLRLIIMNSTGENLTDTTDLYTRVIGKTSVFTGILLLLTDITAVIAIPALKLVILLIMLLIGLAICLTCMTMQIKEIPKKLWICLLKPVLLFALFTIAFAWVISLFVGTGLTSYVGSSSVSIVTNDPTITFLLLFLVNVVYIIGLVYLFIMLFKIAKKEIKGVALAVSGAVAGAVAASAGVNKIKDRIKRGNEKRRLKKLTDKISDPLKDIKDNTNEASSKESKGIESEGHTNLDDTDTRQGRNKASSLMNDLNSGSEEEKKNNKALDDIDVGRHKTRGLSAEVSKMNNSNESIGSKAATKYMDIAAGAQTGINSIKGAWNKVKSGAFAVKSGVSRVGKSIVDKDTYKSLVYSAKTTVGNAKDSIVDKATSIKDSVVDTARDAREQFSAANDLLAERKAQLAEAREKEYEKAINATIEVNQKKVFERKENAAKFDEAREEKRKHKDEIKNEKDAKKKELQKEAEKIDPWTLLAGK